jgi:peptidoglycan/LPS O-acetylase OafA/YrhL
LKLLHIQVLRGLAALSVAAQHAQHDAAALAERVGGGFRVSAIFPWSAGVDLFFVISGFVMVYASRGLFAEAGASQAFFARRIARVVPLYWAAITLYLAVALALPALLNRDYLDLPYILASYLFIPTARPDGLVQPVYPIGWTLDFEMFFYALFALAVLLPRRQAVAALLGGLVGLVALGRLFALPQPLANWTDPLILEFAAGAVLGLLRTEGVCAPRALRVALALAGLGGLVLAAAEPTWVAGWHRAALWGAPAALIVAAAALTPAAEDRETPWSRFGAAVGDASYALYLVHPFVIRGLRELAWRSGLFALIGPWGFVVLALVLSVVVAYVIFRWFELPMTAAARRWLEPRHAVTGLAGAPRPARVGRT